MLPYVEVLGRQLPLYSLAALAGLGLAALCVKLRSRAFPALAADAGLIFLYALIGGVVGAKLLYLLTCRTELIADLPALFRAPAAFSQKYLTGGFVFYGGLFGALLAAWLYSRRCRLDFWEVMRLTLPSLPLFHAFGRVGCFFAGCCYGVPTDRWFGVVFHRSPLAPNGVPLVPVQLIEAAAELALFACLLRAAARTDGCRLLGGYLAAYGAVRFVLECFRGDAYRGFIGAVSVSQAISVACAAAGIWLMVTAKKLPQGA